MIKEPVKHSSIITVVKPLCAFPSKKVIIASRLAPRPTINTITPSIVTICIGADVKDVILVRAYLKRALVLHLDVPTSLSLTSYSTSVDLNPIQDESALKNAFFSRMLRRTFIAFLSRSLKSDALDISKPTEFDIMP